jgi:hypothetical protein
MRFAFLDELAQWQQVNREAIKDTRPWKIYGEGPSTRAGQITAYQLSKRICGRLQDCSTLKDGPLERLCCRTVLFVNMFYSSLLFGSVL